MKTKIQVLNKLNETEVYNLFKTYLINNALEFLGDRSIIINNNIPDFIYKKSKYFIAIEIKGSGTKTGIERGYTQCWSYLKEVNKSFIVIPDDETITLIKKELLKDLGIGLITISRSGNLKIVFDFSNEKDLNKNCLRVSRIFNNSSNDERKKNSLTTTKVKENIMKILKQNGYTTIDKLVNKLKLDKPTIERFLNEKLRPEGKVNILGWEYLEKGQTLTNKKGKKIWCSSDFDLSWNYLPVKIIPYPHGFDGLIFSLVNQEALTNREIFENLANLGYNIKLNDIKKLTSKSYRNGFLITIPYITKNKRRGFRYRYHDRTDMNKNKFWRNPEFSLLLEEKGAMTIREIATNTGYTASYVNTQIKKLIKKKEVIVLGKRPSGTRIFGNYKFIEKAPIEFLSKLQEKILMKLKILNGFEVYDKIVKLLPENRKRTIITNIRNLVNSRFVERKKYQTTFNVKISSKGLGYLQTLDELNLSIDRWRENEEIVLLSPSEKRIIKLIDEKKYCTIEMIINLLDVSETAARHYIHNLIDIYNLIIRGGRIFNSEANENCRNFYGNVFYCRPEILEKIPFKYFPISGFKGLVVKIVLEEGTVMNFYDIKNIAEKIYNVDFPSDCIKNACINAVENGELKIVGKKRTSTGKAANAYLPISSNIEVLTPKENIMLLFKKNRLLTPRKIAEILDYESISQINKYLDELKNENKISESSTRGLTKFYSLSSIASEISPNRLPDYQEWCLYNIKNFKNEFENRKTKMFRKYLDEKNKIEWSTFRKGFNDLLKENYLDIIGKKYILTIKGKKYIGGIFGTEFD